MPDKAYLETITKVLQNDAVNNNIPFPGHNRSEGPVESVDLMADANKEKHNTGNFDLVNQNVAMYRRGEPFELSIRFKESFKLGDKNLRLEFVTGGKPFPKKCNISLDVSSDLKDFTSKNKWEVRVKNEKDNAINLEVQPAVDCPIGVWRMTVVTQPGDKAFDVTSYFYMLFNPWCKDDTVYMENSEWRNEYVLNEEGVIGKSGFNKDTNTAVAVVEWGYDQSHPTVLSAALNYLETIEHDYMEKAFEAPLDKSSPVEVSRALTFSRGPDGKSFCKNICKGECRCKPILKGRWDGEYEAGTHPTSWKNSSAIFTQYMEELVNVRYGQCWVFAAITCSMCRALGIPCRVVTTFSSAHDVNKNIQVDTTWKVVVNEKNEKQEVYLEPRKPWDSAWNFHVWNDAWMARPDLPEGYGGWQAIDACPQELTWFKIEQDKFKGSMVCGPVSIAAIKKGETNNNYDTLWLFSEVGAQHNKWVMQDETTARLQEVSKHGIGVAIVTKKVGSTIRNQLRDPTPESMETITDLYRPNGTTEREKLLQKIADSNGLKLRTKEDIGMEKNINTELDSIATTMAAKPKTKDDVHFELVPLKNVMIGGEVIICGIVENRGNKKRTIDMIVGANSTEYTGVLLHNLKLAGSKKCHKKTMELAPGQREINAVRVTLTPEMYLGHLGATAHIRVYIAIVVKETKLTKVYDEFVVLSKPSLILEMPKKLKKGAPFTLKLKLTNPVKKELKNCSFYIHAPFIKKNSQIKFRNIKPNEKIVHEVKLTPDWVKSGVVLASFTSDILKDVHGSFPATF